MDLFNQQNLQQQFDDFKREFEKFKKLPLKDHFHTGIDVSRINYTDIFQKKVYIHHTVVGTAAATATNYGTFFIAPFACYLNKFYEIHQTAGNDAGAVTLTLEKLTGTTAPDSGTVMLDSALSLKATANTLQTGTLTTAIANRNLAIGNRLCLKDSGTPTTVSNVSIIVELILT